MHVKKVIGRLLLLEDLAVNRTPKALPPPGANAHFCAFEPDARDPSGWLTDGIVARGLSFQSSASTPPGEPTRAWITLLLGARRLGTSGRHKVSSDR